MHNFVKKGNNDRTMTIFKDIDLNIQYLKDNFKDCGDFVERKIPAGPEIQTESVYIAYIDGMIDRRAFEMSVVNPLTAAISDVSNFEPRSGDPFYTAFDVLKDKGFKTADIKEETEFNNIIAQILTGDTAVFIDGFTKAIIVSTKGFPNRGVPKADTEVVVQGPQEAFNEVLRNNTALIRRRIRDSRLKTKQMRVGVRSLTDIAVIYLEDVVRPNILNEALRRLERINTDAILDCGYIEQYIEDDHMSPFPQTQITERPDKAASAILEGRIVIVVDNSPFVLIIPAVLNCFYQSSEDYYQRFQIMTLARLIRYAAGFVAFALPGLYIALTVYHPSMIPLLLALRIADSRRLVPLPCVLEVLIMELAFELLREAGIRLPGAVGSSIGIIGGLIVGQAAVEAGIVCPSVVVVVALTGIASFSIPQYSLTAGFRLMKYLVIVLSATLGLLGFWAALLIILIHLVSLKSFGIPYMLPYSSGGVNNYDDLKDSIFRLPLFLLKKRPFFANPENRDR